MLAGRLLRGAARARRTQDQHTPLRHAQKKQVAVVVGFICGAAYSILPPQGGGGGARPAVAPGFKKGGMWGAIDNASKAGGSGDDSEQ